MPRGLGPLNPTWLQHFKSVSGSQLQLAAGQAPHTAHYQAVDLQQLLHAAAWVQTATAHRKSKSRSLTPLHPLCVPWEESCVKQNSRSTTFAPGIGL